MESYPLDLPKSWRDELKKDSVTPLHFTITWADGDQKCVKVPGMSSVILAYAIVVDDVGLDGIYSATVTCSSGHMHDVKKEIGVEYE